MKKLLFTAIGLAAAAFVVKKLCYTSHPCDNCEETDECDNCRHYNAENEEKTAEKEADSAEGKANNGEME